MSISLSWAIFILVMCMSIEFIILIVFFAKKYPHAGTVVIDIRRTATDSIYVESPKNITKWKDYKMLRFDVEIKQFDKPSEF